MNETQCRLTVYFVSGSMVFPDKIIEFESVEKAEDHWRRNYRIRRYATINKISDGQYVRDLVPIRSIRKKR